jgi:tetratricopeptide (TPR) repeat protein
MPIESLSLRGTVAASLAPLKGMPLKSLDGTSIPAADFEVLAGAPLETVMLQRVRVRDLGFLKGMPVRKLSLWGCNEARNYAALADLERLELLILADSCISLPEEEQLAIDALEQHPRLRQVSDEIMGGMLLDTTGPKHDFWPRWKSTRKLRKELKSQGVAFSMQSRTEGGVSLHVSSSWFQELNVLKGHTEIVGLDLSGTSVSDLSPLRELPLELLLLKDTRVRDLEPLRGMKLRHLDVLDSQVTDLSPLAGMPLEYLYFPGTNVKDLSPLRGMPLRYIHFDRTDVSDVSPLTGIKTLQRIILPSSARNIESLKELPSLEYISFSWDAKNWRPSMTAEEFWAAFAARSEESNSDEASRLSLSHALKQQPGEPRLWIERAKVYANAGKPDLAAADWAKGIVLLEKNPHWNSPRTVACLDLAEHAELFEQVAAIIPDEQALWIGRGQYHALLSRWDAAAKDYGKAYRLRTSIDEVAFEYAGTLLLTAQTQEYQDVCNQLLADCEQGHIRFEAFVVARACALAPQKSIDPARVVALAKEYDDDAGEPWAAHVLGLAHYRAGNFKLAIAKLQESNSGDWFDAAKAQNSLVFSMVHHQLGNQKEAQEWLQRGRLAIDAVRTTPNGEGVHLGSTDRIELAVLLKEATALVNAANP